jgi:SseB protein N-terminal domain
MKIRAYSPHTTRGIILAPDSENIEELIGIAAQEQDPEARRLLFHALRSIEVFLPFEAVRQGGKEVKATPLLRLPDGTHAMMAYTSKSHPDLPDKFGGATFESALAAALKMPALDWVVVTNRASQWVAISKEHIPALLDDLHRASNKNGSLEPPAADPTVKIVEELITRAVESKSGTLSAPIGSALGDRELFLEMGAQQSEDGRASMKTFQIEHLAHVIRAYTSRARPGIKYGGIKWQELKDMIGKAPEINGVQIMNNADDWIVFDREALGLNPSSES